MTQVTIRQAKPLDTSNLVRLLTAAHDEAGAYPPVDPAHGLNWITRTLTEGYVIVADVSGRLVGTLALTNYQFPWSPKWYLYLEWLFVQKKFRKGGSFEALIQACHAYADSHDAPLIAGVSSADTKVLFKDKLFKQHGYLYMGGDFIRSEASERNGRQEETGVNADVQPAVMG
jgi:hypothetical protein